MYTFSRFLNILSNKNIQKKFTFKPTVKTNKTTKLQWQKFKADTEIKDDFEKHQKIYITHNYQTTYEKILDHKLQLRLGNSMQN